MELTLKINQQSKVGKTLLDVIELFAKSNNQEVEIIKTSKKSHYNPEFVKKIKDAEKRGEYTTVNFDDVWGSLGLK